MGISSKATLPEFAGIAALTFVLTGCPVSDDYFIVGTGSGGKGGTTAARREVGGSVTGGADGTNSAQDSDTGGTAIAAGGGGSVAGSGGVTGSRGGAPQGAGGTPAGADGSTSPGVGGVAPGAGGTPAGAGGSTSPGIGGVGLGAGGGVPPSAGGSASPGVGGAGGSAPQGGAAGSGSAGAGATVVYSSGFESGITGWSVFGNSSGGVNVSAASDQAHGGSKSLLIAGRHESYQGPAILVTNLVTQGASYRVRLWARLTGTNSVLSGFAITANAACTSGDEVYSPFLKNQTLTASDWTEMSGTGAIPTCAGGTNYYAPPIRIYVEGPTNASSFYIDDIEVDAL